MRTPVFTGVCTALVTPFHESGGIDYPALERLLDRQMDANIPAVCICGTTGEASTLSFEERDELAKFCVKYIGGRAKVIAGTGSNNTQVALRLSQSAKKAGVDGLLMVTPYYNKTTQAGLAAHYKAIAQQVDLPIILYNVPSRTGLSFGAETYAQLAQDPRFNGVKEASGSLALVTHTRSLCPKDFSVWSGNDDQVVPIMALGGMGVISVASNLIPEVMKQLCDLCLSGDFKGAAEIQTGYASLIDALFCEVNPIPVKAAMELLGLCSGHVRLPLCRPSREHLEQIRRELVRFGLI
ncbi:MAG: 4-hydroxy-tetrahydrodipicolinate synthase [Oscillospiraceae bacterium]|nr:4-hydroxy-tetrahydrodipicolinate synthase [Oscillospiraceae bacterium]